MHACRWARQHALAKREKGAAAALLLRLCSAHALELQRQALISWKESAREVKEADTVVSPPPQNQPLACKAQKDFVFRRTIYTTSLSVELLGITRARA